MVNQFILKLLQNPNFQGLPLSIAELNISNFINQNIPNLGPMLTGQNFFPGKSPQEAAELLLAAMRRYIADRIIHRSKEILPAKINFAILDKVDDKISIPPEEIRGQLFGLYEKVIGHREVRQKIDLLNIIIEQNLIDNYVMSAFDDKSYIYNELGRVERHKFAAADIRDYMKFSSLFFPCYCIKITDAEAGLNGVNAHDLTSQSAVQEVYFKKIDLLLTRLIQNIHNDIWDTVKAAFHDFNETPNQDPAAKFMAIMFSRAKDYKVGMTAEKGAETPDKSWFSIQMRNTSYTGLDKDMLDNLNRIAFERGF